MVRWMLVAAACMVAAACAGCLEPFDVSAAPDGTLLVVVGGDLVRVNPAFTEATYLRDGVAYAEYSPDGSKVLLVTGAPEEKDADEAESDDSGDSSDKQTFVDVTITGADLKPLMSLGRFDSSVGVDSLAPPRWSADGAFVAFGVLRSQVDNPEAVEEVPLPASQPSADGAVESTTAASDGEGSETKDDEKDTERFYVDLRVLRADGGKSLVIRDAAVGFDWSPEGARLAAITLGHEEIAAASEVEVWDAAAGKSTESFGAFLYSPAIAVRWPSEGEFLVAAHDIRLPALDAQTSSMPVSIFRILRGERSNAMTRILPDVDKGTDAIPFMEVSPDRRQVAWCAPSADGKSDSALWVASTDGTGAREVATAVDFPHVRWLPDGRIACSVTETVPAKEEGGQAQRVDHLYVIHEYGLRANLTDLVNAAREKHKQETAD